MNIITEKEIESRRYWIEEIRKLSGNFGNDSDRLESELEQEVHQGGSLSLIGHLRLCGNIPESYSHDSSEEKLYSKYTDSLLSSSFNYIGLNSLVLKERADAADVEIVGNEYSFVADAKSFRLSRTAKNQKDFKVQAMDGWKRGKPYAMVVCPIYQLPNSSSQIYHQATTRNVCVFTYSHLSLIVAYSDIEGKDRAQELIHKIFQVIPAMNPSKSAGDYWLALNRTMLGFSPVIQELWGIEKAASSDSIFIGKEEALTFLAQEREKILRMTHEEAIRELVKMNKIESKIKTIQSISDNGLFGIQ